MYIEHNGHGDLLTIRLSSSVAFSSPTNDQGDFDGL
jgi:hypothetical protein